jgi:hypothetical protein
MQIHDTDRYPNETEQSIVPLTPRFKMSRWEWVEFYFYTLGTAALLLGLGYAWGYCRGMQYVLDQPPQNPFGEKR